jgi:hypothetical protein
MGHAVQRGSQAGRSDRGLVSLRGDKAQRLRA